MHYYIAINVALLTLCITLLGDRNQGLEIMAFPCNNFGSQEPGSNAEILTFAKGKGATFPVFGKLECENSVNTRKMTY